jgi:hypothetical protein
VNQTQQLATLALRLIQEARVPANDDDLRAVLMTRGWLQQIANAQLDVIPVLPPQHPHPMDVQPQVAAPNAAPPSDVPQAA